MPNRATSISQWANTPAAKNPANKALFSEETGKVPPLSEKMAGSEGKRAYTGIEKNWIWSSLTEWCEINGYTLQWEYRFHETRRYKFDWFIAEIKTAVEYEGIYSKQSRHTSLKGFSNDCEKYSTASAMGFTVIRVTALNYKMLPQFLETIKNRLP